MGDTRHVRARLAAVLVMVAAGLLGVVPPSPVAAAGPFPAQCVEQVYGDRLVVPAHGAATLADLDIGMPNNFDPFGGDVRLVNGPVGGPPQFSWVLTHGNLDGRIRYAIFDNEAPTIFWGPPPYPEEVRVRPAERFPYYSPSGDPTWSVYVDQYRRLPFHRDPHLVRLRRGRRPHGRQLRRQLRRRRQPRPA